MQVCYLHVTSVTKHMLSNLTCKTTPHPACPHLDIRRWVEGTAMLCGSVLALPDPIGRFALLPETKDRLDGDLDLRQVKEKIVVSARATKIRTLKGRPSAFKFIETISI